MSDNREHLLHDNLHNSAHNSIHSRMHNRMHTSTRNNIYNNKARHAGENQLLPFKTEILYPNDLQSILKLQSLVYESITNKSWYSMLSAEEFLPMLQDKGIIIGTKVNRELIGFYGAFFPGNDPENLGNDLEISSEEFENICHLEVACVHPDHRGKGLQRLLGMAVIKAVRHDKTFRYLCGTVEPDNIIALNNAMHFGLQIVKLKEKYGGLRRFILLRDFEEEFNGNDSESGRISVDYQDVSAQQKLLDEGYRGVAAVARDDSFFIDYTLID